MIRGPLVLEIARKWIGTPFRHQGRTLGKGCDCVGLLSGVAFEAGLIEGRKIEDLEREYAGYSSRPSPDVLRDALRKAMIEISLEDVSVGDFVLMKLAGHATHVGIFTGRGLIHAYQPMRKVVEHRLDRKWERRLVCGYTVGDEWLN